MQNSVPFCVNLVQKIKTVSLSWNFVLRLIPICRISWRWSFFPSSTENTLLGQIWSKNMSGTFRLKFATKTNSSMQNSMVVFTFPILENAFFLTNLVKKIKIATLRRNFVPRQFKYADFNGDVHFFYFRLQVTFFEQIWSKNLNCQFNIHNSNSNMPNSTVMFIYVLERKYPF